MKIDHLNVLSGDGWKKLDAVAAADGGGVAAGLLSALVVWTEPRREEGTGQLFRHTG